MKNIIIIISGILAPTFVVASFLLKKINHIRLVNLIGCIFFIIYGIFKGMLWPIIIPNAILACIQTYKLWICKEPAADRPIEKS